MIFDLIIFKFKKKCTGFQFVKDILSKKIYKRIKVKYLDFWNRSSIVLYQIGAAFEIFRCDNNGIFSSSSWYIIPFNEDWMQNLRKKYEGLLMFIRFKCWENRN